MSSVLKIWQKECRSQESEIESFPLAPHIFTFFFHFTPLNNKHTSLYSRITWDTASHAVGRADVELCPYIHPHVLIIPQQQHCGGKALSVLGDGLLCVNKLDTQAFCWAKDASVLIASGFSLCVWIWVECGQFCRVNVVSSVVVAK